jgi:hypothetical protein
LCGNGDALWLCTEGIFFASVFDTHIQHILECTVGVPSHHQEQYGELHRYNQPVPL